MAVLFLVTCAVALIFSLGLCVNGLQQNSPQERLSQLKTLAENSQGNVITLNDTTFPRYALTGARPYSLIVLLTAANAKFKCTICKEVDTELKLLGNSYAKLIENEKSLFFVRLDYERSKQVFENYDINSIPVLFHIGPSAGVEHYDSHYIAPRDKYQVPANIDAEALSVFVRDRTGITITIVRSPIVTYIIIFVLFSILVALARPIISSLPVLLKYVHSRSTWLVISCGVYTGAISGLIFDVIRSPQMFYANPQTGQVLLFYPHSGNQFVAEGFIIGLLNLTCAASILIITKYVLFIKDEQAKYMTMIGGFLIFAYCFRSIQYYYIMKNPWYGEIY